MTTQALKRIFVTLFLFGSIALVSPAPANAVGVTGIDVYVINSNGVSCGQDCVSQSQAQVALCVRSAQSRIDFTDVSYGYTLRNGATVISTGTYPSPGTRLISASTCAGGYIHTWDFRDLSASETYEVEAWMIDDSVSYSATLVINTPAAYNPSSSTTINPLSTSTTVATETLVPGVPQVDMYEGPRVGTWNLVDNATGQVMTTSVCTPLVCGRNGEWRTWPADRLLNGRYWPTGYPENATYIWNPIGAGSGGQYYTNGLYVTSWGQHILPGTSTLVAVVSPPQTTLPSNDSSGDGAPSEETTTTSTTSTTSTTIAAVEGARSVNAGAPLVDLIDVGLIVQKSGSKYSIVATSPLRNAPIVIRATAKGKPTITWTTKTNVNAQKLIMSTRSLKGYTISMWVNGRRISSIKAD
ncbi:hypothetical protein LBMAG07_03540 [Actinomycetes bacterium]|nr:hypothetical protein LBMAG07_03540 [Actinomycetes bacterium]